MLYLKFLRQLGLVPTWQFGDVYGLELEVLSLVPRPVCAVLLLFPITEKVQLKSRPYKLCVSKINSRFKYNIDVQYEMISVHLSLYLL